MSNRNLIIAPCGNGSSFFLTEWVKQYEQKEFDLCLLFYHAEIQNPQLYQKADYFFHLKGFKFGMIYELLTTVQPGLLYQYDYFYFLDDDIKIDTVAINKLFTLGKAFDVWIAQAALTKDSFYSWPVLLQQNNNVLRYMGQVEVMAPLFNRYALEICLPSFVANKSSWGLDTVWPKLLGYPKDKLVVFDNVVMKHANPVGGGELYKKIAVDPYREWEEVIKKYDAIAINYVVYGRLLLTTPKTNWLYFKLAHWQWLLRDFKKMVREKKIVYTVKKYIKDRRRHTKYSLHSAK